MSKNISIQILINLTFILFISCADNNSKLFGSTHFLKPLNNTNFTLPKLKLNQTTIHKPNATVYTGKFTIENSTLTFNNGSTIVDIRNILRKKFNEVKNAFKFLVNSLKSIFGSSVPTPNITLPTFMGKNATFIGNGTYKYSNFSDGHSLQIKIEGTRLPHMKANSEHNANQNKKNVKKVNSFLKSVPSNKTDNSSFVQIHAIIE